MSDPSTQSDLDLLAFRYVSGELSVAETHDFEQRLDDDQAAREAVEHAVLTAEAVASHPEAAADLNLLAFRYTQDELSPAQVDGFERRLEHDQGAREAVAYAVLVAEAVTQRASRPAPAPVLARLWPMAAAVAAALAMAFLLPMEFTSHTAVASKTASDEPEALIASWLEMAPADEGAESMVFEPLGETALVDPLDLSELDEPGGTPAWLMQALEPQM